MTVGSTATAASAVKRPKFCRASASDMLRPTLATTSVRAGVFSSIAAITVANEMLPQSTTTSGIKMPYAVDSGGPKTESLVLMITTSTSVVTSATIPQRAKPRSSTARSGSFSPSRRSLTTPMVTSAASDESTRIQPA